VLGPWRAVVIDHHVVAEHLLDGIAAADRSGAARKRGVSQQQADGREIAAVDELGVGCDEALDRPVARFFNAGAHSTRA